MAKKDEKTPPKEEHEPEESEHEEDETEEEESDEEESDEDRDEDEEDDEDDEEDGDEDEDDEEDEGEEEEHHARGVVGPVSHEEQDPHAADPTWWLPHAVLGALVVIGVLGFFGAFTSLLGPPLLRLGIISPMESAPAPSSSAPAPASQPKPQPPTQVRPMQPPVQPAPAPNQGEMLGAKHLVVMYKGSERAPGNITRSKEEAQKRAAEALAALKAKGGKNWDEIVAKYSDEPGADQSHGDLHRFSPAQMTPLFTAAVKKIKVGEMSDVVETPFGFHVILRTF